MNVTSKIYNKYKLLIETTFQAVPYDDNNPNFVVPGRKRTLNKSQLMDYVQIQFPEAQDIVPGDTENISKLSYKSNKKQKYITPESGKNYKW